MARIAVEMDSAKRGLLVGRLTFALMAVGVMTKMVRARSFFMHAVSTRSSPSGLKRE
ncbi:hypothetical protein LPB67_16065 [Undibacterium sp. Jales W-56]|uniref:hypothetical protein n=1 Tax=Undibacterium sp. Jales W-56 TaxID=2897325 RepID=UPI0021CE07DE|nr:hypothetical protein [Undibacterium sp. Jales W-56]MCU6435292.1 hypothetical protein [Undibacterium sp. Jales W-56]